MAKTTKTREVNVLSLDKPVALTLTGSPANQIAFRVVRGDGGDTKVVRSRIRKVQNSYRDGFLCIKFPEGASREDVEATAAEYGIKDYEIAETETGLQLRRSDYKEAENPIEICLSKGRKAVIERSSEAETQPRELSGLKLIAIDFDRQIFRSDEDIQKFLSEIDIDFASVQVENTDTHSTVKRSDAPEGETVGKMQVAEGVTFHIVRAEENDIPEMYYTVVNEAAYGSWGWGQLDFAAMLLDIEFSNLAEEAIRILSRVVNEILFYSYLPLAVRKELVFRAAAQFALYVGSLLDGLPPGVVMVERSANNSQSKEIQDMSTKTDSTKKEDEVKRSDDAVKASEQTNEVGAQSDESKKDYITRADAEEMISSAVTAAIAAFREETANVQRSDDPGAEGQKKEEANKEEVPDLASSLQAIQRSVEQLNETVSNVDKRVQAVENGVIVRSDDGDDKQEKKVQRSDPFAGIFSRRGKADE